MRLKQRVGGGVARLRPGSSAQPGGVVKLERIRQRHIALGAAFGRA